MEKRGRKQGMQSSICFDCANALGGCSWSAFDPDADTVRFEPVPGWEAEYGTKIEMRGYVPTEIETVRVIKCPQFEKDSASGRGNASALTEKAEQEFLENPGRFLEKYGKFY